MTNHRFRAVAFAIVTMAALAACSSPKPNPLVGSQAPPPSVAPTSSGTPSQSAAPATFEPMTGLPGAGTGSVIAVPINVGKGAPAPVGLADADIVSLEYSEAGGMHLVGMFQSKYPSKVGPLAEVRPSDMKIVCTTNPLIVQTGAPSGFLDTAKSLNLTVHTGSRSTAGFAQSGSSLYAEPNVLRAGAKGQPNAMFEYAQAGEALSRLNVDQVSKVVVTVPGHVSITWTLDGTTKVWHTQIGGVTMTTTNLVIITSPYMTKHVSALRRDLTYSDPLGSGAATVVAGDSKIAATWSKKSFNSALNLLGPDQDTPRLTAGPTWLMLTPPGSKVTAS